MSRKYFSADIYGVKADMHEADKLPIGIRLAKATANQIYGLKDYEERGPFPQEFKVQNGTNNLIIVYDKPIQFHVENGFSGNTHRMVY